MIALKRLIGLPVVQGGEALGYVERGVLTEGATRLRGVVVRKGLGMAHWFPRAQIELIGRQCVLVRGEPERPPKQAGRELGCCYVSECAGLVTDALLLEGSLRVAALEVSAGPLFSLAGPKRYAVEYRVRTLRKGESGEVIAAGLLTWQQMLDRMGKEE
ncbi:MAG: hypothetical protein PHY12_08900 [Eubacteriales bacterium]|nr:hypothetical protein [Eubacteriales bacterium]